MDYKNQIDKNKQKILEYRKLIFALESQNLELETEINKEKEQKELIQLNCQQKQAVEESTNNSIIIACPGSGKTHTLIAKVVHLIKNKKVLPNRIIMITFTKKASKEMNDRLGKNLGQKRLLHIGTLHGLAYRTLQKYDKINYTILDEKDAHKIILDQFEEIIKKNQNANLTKEIQSMVYKKIIIIYDILTSKYPIKVDDLVEKFKLIKYKKIVKETLTAYDDFKKTNRYLDFNDLMIRFLNFLKESKSSTFRNRYDYILFDEYQDINSIQDLILKEMNKKCQNLTVVGDDAQAIYAFRGSEVKYIINFKSSYLPVKTYFLEKNYRSTPEIVDFCNNIISHNNNQLDKKMVATKTESLLKPKIIGFHDTTSEVEYIVGRIKYNTQIGTKLIDNVIITRTNRQLDKFELELIKNKISYIKSKGIGILNRVHVKDFLAFLIILVNGKSSIHWKRILKLVPGVGSVTINKIVHKDKNMFEILNNSTFFVGKQYIKLLAPLNNLLNKLQNLHNDKKEDPEVLKIKICDEIINYLKPIIKKNMKIKEQTSFDEKISDLETLKSYISSSDSIQQFLIDIHLNVEIEESNIFDQDEGDNDDYLLLSTIHGSKGLEWDYVFLSGCSSDIMPSFKPKIYTDEMDDIEEERRLFYVGCSRAKKSLELTLSYDYHFMGSQIYASPFIRDINPELYNGVNLIYPTRIKKGDVTRIINNYLILKSVSKIYPYIKNIPYEYKSYYIPHVETQIYKNRCEIIYGTFVDNLIAKMVYQHFADHIGEFSVPVYTRHNLRKDKPYFDYIDPNNDWKDCLESILKVSIRKTRIPIKFQHLKELIINDEQLIQYDNINKMIKEITADCLKQCKDLGKLPPDLVNLHHNLSFGDIMGEADMVVGRTLIEIKTSRKCIATTKYVLQTIMYRYLLRKKGIRIDRIIMLNPLLGETYTLQITPKWKDTFRVYREIIKCSD